VDRWCALLVAVAACGLVSRDEVARVRSPDGDVEAVLVETNAGATTSFGYDVLLVPAGGNLEEGRHTVTLEGATRNPRAYGVNLVWTSPDRLRVEYFEAQWVGRYTSPVSIGAHTIEVGLRDSVVDAAAPPGGMLYNRERRREQAGQGSQ
jgi:hypothetical protein